MAELAETIYSKHPYAHLNGEDEEIYTSLAERNNARRKGERDFIQTANDIFSTKKPLKEKLSGNKNQMPKTGELRYAFYEEAFEHIRSIPLFSECICNMDSFQYVPKLRAFGLPQEVDEKIMTIFLNKHVKAYRKFKYKVEETLRVKSRVLQNIIDKEALRAGKSSLKVDITNLNPKILNLLTSYYSTSSQIKDFVLKYRQGCANSLADLINQTYREMRRTPGIQN